MKLVIKMQKVKETKNKIRFEPGTRDAAVDCVYIEKRLNPPDAIQVIVIDDTVDADAEIEAMTSVK